MMPPVGRHGNGSLMSPEGIFVASVNNLEILSNTGPAPRTFATRSGVTVSSCHTGFGYAPAPLGRLRKRLSLLHGAKVTLVDEYNTSQYCCRCHHALLKPKVTHSRAKIEGSKSLTKKLERNIQGCKISSLYTFAVLESPSHSLWRPPPIHLLALAG